MNREGPWVAISCGLYRNPKLRRVSPLARSLYVAGLLHCGDELTDGRIEASALPALLLETGARRTHVRELVSTLLWRYSDVTPTSDLLIPDYLQWNPSRDEWNAQRLRKASNQAAYRSRVTGNTTGHTNGHETGSVPGRVSGVTRERERTTRENGQTTGRVDPTRTCPDCGERQGHGHAETCPRMPPTASA